MRKRSIGVSKEIVLVRTTLRALDRSLRKLSSAVTAMPQLAPNGSVRRRPRLSARTRAALVLQGRYMGYMRQLKPRQKSLVKGLKASKGIQAAIARARSFAQKD